MKKLLIAYFLFILSFACYSQEDKKIELAFMDYTESDSAFYNTDVPESHYSYDNFDLFYRFAGDTQWVKIKKGKALINALKTNNQSHQEAKKYQQKRRNGKILLIGGLAGGAILAITVSPIGGVALVLASSGTGLLFVTKSEKHLYKAIDQYNKSLK